MSEASDLVNMRVYVRQLESRLEKLERSVGMSSGREAEDLRQENEALRRDFVALEAQYALALREKQEVQNKLTDVENNWEHMVEEEKRARWDAKVAMVSATQNLDDLTQSLNTLTNNLLLVTQRLGGGQQ